MSTKSQTQDTGTSRGELINAQSDSISPYDKVFAMALELHYLVSCPYIKSQADIQSCGPCPTSGMGQARYERPGPS